ncbi:MAG: stage II sporulation protein SpoIID, partial [Oscillospiraceae bacterium]|nr:stage II sporulation protein SpoIID [Oscillospiraceae bacterium]
DGSVANVASGSGAGGSGGAAAPSQPAYVFTGTGWGHGVGMSQEGAKGLAERGYGYREILAHYFPGTVVA